MPFMPLRFLLLTHFEPHFGYFSDQEEAEEFEHYATRNLKSMSRFFPHHSVEWTVWRYDEFACKTAKEMLEYDAIFIGGSPWNVTDNRDWFVLQKALFSHFFHHQIFPPVFGICFGHQFLASFFGGTVSDLSIPIKSEVVFTWGNSTLRSWANHRQYVSQVPSYATVHVWLDKQKTIPYIIQFDGRVWGIQSHIEVCLEDASSEAFWTHFFQKKILGHCIGQTKVLDISLDVEFFPKDTGAITLDKNGNYLGKKGSCVELVRRFLYAKTGINFAHWWQEGNAQDWYINAESMHLCRIEEKTHVQAGDILCFSGGLSLFGHVALVQEVTETGVFIVQQNCFQDERDLRFFLPFSCFHFQGFAYQGALRYND